MSLSPHSAFSMYCHIRYFNILSLIPGNYPVTSILTCVDRCHPQRKSRVHPHDPHFDLDLCITTQAFANQSRHTAENTWLRTHF